MSTSFVPILLASAAAATPNAGHLRLSHCANPAPPPALPHPPPHGGPRRRSPSPRSLPPAPPCAGADADCDATLPVDLLLEIAARSDAVSVVRCTAAAKPLRRAILDRGFRRLLAQRATATSGYDPSLLRGVSYKIEDSDADRPARVVQAVPPDEPSVLRFNESLAFEPVASRDGLVVLRRLRPRPLFGQSIEEGPPGSVLRVCHSFTGAVSVLPSVSIRDYRKHALLSVDDNGRSFEVLIADERLRIQIYSSREGRWGPVRAAIPRRQSRPFHDSYPLVIGRTVHWLCNPEPLPPGRHLSGPEPYIVPVDADTMEAKLIVGLIRLNLATKEAVIVYHRSDTAYISQVCLHEIDLSSLLQTMKPLS